MVFFRAVKSFFSILLKFIVVIALMGIFAFVSYEGVTYYITGSFKDVREVKKAAEDNQTVMPIQSTEVEKVEVNHENSLVSMLVYEDKENNYFDIRIHIIDKNTGALDIVLLPPAAKITVPASLKKTLSDRLDLSGGQVSFEDVARAYPEEKYGIIQEMLAEDLGLDFNSYEVMNPDGMQTMLSYTEALDIKLKHDLTYRDSDHNLQVMKATEEAMTSDQLVTYMAYMDGTASQTTARLEHNTEILEKYIPELLGKMSAVKAYKRYKELVTVFGQTDDEAILAALKKTDANAVTVRILEGSDSYVCYTIDTQKAQLQISGLLSQAASYNADTATDSVQIGEDGTVSIATGTKIELYNAAYISKLAAAWKDYLEKHGYVVTKIDDYKEGTLNTTEIVVTQEGMEEDLLKYFPDAVVTVEDIPSGAAMIVYLGRDSAYILPGHENSKPEGVELEDDTQQPEEATTEIEIIED